MEQKNLNGMTIAEIEKLPPELRAYEIAKVKVINAVYGGKSNV